MSDAPLGASTVRMLGRVEYAPTLEAMVAFTAERKPDTPDEIWLCEHPPVYTQGIAGRAEHVTDAGRIPVVQTQRGGQVTYHGPGQVVAYPLIDLRRLGIYVKEYVYRLEHCAIRTLEAYGITGHRVAGAPGIYVRLDDPGSHASLPQRPLHGTSNRPAGADTFTGLGKVAALGIKVSRHCTYHGLAMNVAMDLSPFAGIDPCGYRGLRTVDMATLGAKAEPDSVARRLGAALASHLSL